MAVAMTAPMFEQPLRGSGRSFDKLPVEQVSQILPSHVGMNLSAMKMLMISLLEARRSSGIFLFHLI